MGWIAGRVYRQKITIQEGNVFADHTDFPVAIKITGANEVFTKAQSNGYDIVFSNDADETLSYERVRWDPGSQFLFVYVKTDLSSTEATTLYMYYGNGGNTVTTDGQDADGVWASHYKGVYHFEEASGQLQDATSNARNSTTANQVKYRYSGLLSYACYFDGSGDYFILPSSLSVGGNAARTVTAYFYPDYPYNSMSTWTPLLRLGGESSTGRSYLLSLDNGGECSPSESIGLHYWSWNTCTGERVVTSGDEILTSTWHQYAGTHNGSTTQRVFLNGTQRGTSSYTLNTVSDVSYIAYRPNSGVYYRGRLSEIRVSNVDLGSDWVRTEYENMINNDTFFVLAAEEDTPYLIEDIPTAITIFDAPNMLDGTRNYLTEFTLSVASTVYYDMPTDVSLADIVQTTSGTDDIAVELGLSASGILTDAELDTDVDLYISSSGIFNTDVRNTALDFTVGRQPVPITDPYGGVDVRNELGIGYLVTPSGYGEDVDVEFGIGTTYDTESNLDVDFSIATSAMFNYKTEVFASTISGTWETDVAGGWADATYGYRQEITIDSSVLSNSVTDFPLALKVGIGNDIFDKARADGYDIFFTEDDGVTVLDYERSIYDAGSTDFQAFVKTDLSSTVDTVIYMYYGYASAGDQSTGSAAWDASFDAVWHFEDGTYTGAANEVQDSSGNGNHGRRGSGNFQGFDSTWGQALNITDSDDWMRFESNLNINAEYTISCLFWIPLSGSTSWHTLTRGSSYHQIILQNDHQLGNYRSGFHSSGFDMDTLGAGLHHLAVVRLPGGTGDFYVDGSFVGNAALQPDDDIYAVGNYQGNGQVFGKIDEFRVSASVGRTASWVKAEYESLINYATFVTFGDPVSPSGHWVLASRFETDVTVSGGLSYPINVDVFSSVSGTQYNMEADLYISLANTTPSGLPQGTLISGSYFSTDVTTSGGLSYPLETDLYVSLANSISGQPPVLPPNQTYIPPNGGQLDFDFDDALFGDPNFDFGGLPGSHFVDQTIASGGYFSADMRLFALQIDNFFLDVDEYVKSTATMYVDITDKRGIPIDTANSYFIIDGVPVTSGIWFTPVSRPTASGYRMYYDPPGDFVADDSTEVIVHAQNVINDWLEQTYYLLWGYNLIVNATELHSWGWDKEVIVWSTASNLARCPAESADAWHFRTAPKPFKDLSASIVPQVKHKDLSAVIYPISTAIYYDGTYKITVNLKDSAGNEMPPFILEFTVEDKPN